MIVGLKTLAMLAGTPPTHRRLLGTSFCGNEANVMQEVFQGQVQQSCAVVEDGVSLRLAMMQQGFRSYVSAGIYAKVYAPKVKRSSLYLYIRSGEQQN